MAKPHDESFQSARAKQQNNSFPCAVVAATAAGVASVVKSFHVLSRKGFATDGEVKRQLDALLGSLEREATRPWNESAEVAEEQSVSPWRADDPSGLSYRLMQYNPPYTLPWLRTNAVAVKVAKGEAEAALGAGAVDIPVSVLVDDGGGGR